MTRAEYNHQRQELISRRRSLRLRVCQSRKEDRAALQAKFDALPETPPKLDNLYGYELLADDGAYEGFTMLHEEAKTLAAENGWSIHNRKAFDTNHLDKITEL